MNPHSYRLKGRDFVHQGKIEIDVNERAVFIRTQGCFFVYTNSDCFLNSLYISSKVAYLNKQGEMVKWKLMNIGSVTMVSGEILASFFMSFCTSKNNFKKLLKSCPILSLPIQSICSFFFSFFGEFFFEIFFTLIVEYNGCIIQKFFLSYWF